MLSRERNRRKITGMKIDVLIANSKPISIQFFDFQRHTLTLMSRVVDDIEGTGASDGKNLFSLGIPKMIPENGPHSFISLPKMYLHKTSRISTQAQMYTIAQAKWSVAIVMPFIPCFFFWRDPIPSSPEDRNQCTSMANTLVVYARLYYDFWPKGLRRGSDFLFFFVKMWCLGGGLVLDKTYSSKPFFIFYLKENVTSWNWIILDLPLVRKTCSNTWGMGHHS